MASRVIAPNFPGYGLTRMNKNKHFKPTPLEKATFVREFLEKLGIKKVDLGIVYSLSFYPGMILCSEEFNVFESAVMINPSGLGEHRSLIGFQRFRFIYGHYQKPILRPISLFIMKIVLILGKFPNTNVHQMLLTAEALSCVPYEEFKFYPKSMNLRNVPSVLVTSLTDFVLPPHLAQDLAKLLGARGTTVYDKQGKVKICTENKGEEYPWHYVFERGGHFLMKKFPVEINEILDKFLSKVLKEKINE